jgi:anthranilate/para-aminobenzoate synthase component I
MSIVLSELEAMSSFALFSPDFSRATRGTQHWTLITGLSSVGESDVVSSSAWSHQPQQQDSGNPQFFFVPFQDKSPRGFRGSLRTGPLIFNVNLIHITTSLDDSRYEQNVEGIRQLIAAGDVYQVNLTLRAKLSQALGSQLLATFSRHQIPRFAAWVRLPNGTEFVSASPEMLFETSARLIRVEPMKGTAHPSRAANLEASDKDAAELAMIVDLLRDDLHRLCVPKTVLVTNPRRLIELPYAVQTVGDIEGTLSDEVTLQTILSHLHPGGSVTGAPREAACEVISRLEPTPRNAYCGVLGHTTATGTVASLLIRTAQKTSSGQFIYGVGGGITWDSVPQLERAEIDTKLGIFL